MPTETLTHPPKPADVGLGRDNDPAHAQSEHIADEPSRSEHVAPVDPHDVPPPAGHGDTPPLSTLLRTLSDEAIHLVRQEINLAKTEASEKASFFASQGGKFGLGAGVALAGAIGLLIAISFLLGGLIDGLLDDAINASAANGIGFLLTSIPAVIIGYTILKKAQEKLKSEPVAPERTIQSLQDDKLWAQNKARETAAGVKQEPSNVKQTVKDAVGL
jgi:hypothetical protein